MKARENGSVGVKWFCILMPMMVEVGTRSHPRNKTARNPHWHVHKRTLEKLWHRVPQSGPGSGLGSL